MQHKVEVRRAGRGVGDACGLRAGGLRPAGGPGPAGPPGSQPPPAGHAADVIGLGESVQHELEVRRAGRGVGDACGPRVVGCGFAPSVRT